MIHDETRYIAHRALFNGPDPEKENHPDQILKALEAGWECEIDVRYIDKKWWLGHDEPTYEVSKNFLYRPNLWMHCKNLEALERVASLRCVEKPHYFWHDTDDFTLTSHGIIWTYPEKPLTSRSVLVQPEWDVNWRLNVRGIECLGICSKFVHEIREMRNLKTYY